MKKQLTISKSRVLARSLLPAIQLTSTIPSVRTSLNRSLLPRGFFLIALASLALACFALSPPAGAACLSGCNTGLGNTFLGDSALGSNTTGLDNTAIGSVALQFNTTGFSNTAVGAFALEVNTTGTGNTATGFGALFKNTASGNSAFGSAALEFNTTGSFNTANGQGALNQNTTGGDNTANGQGALAHNTTASNNTATGYQALNSNTTGIDNTAAGFQALFSNTTGSTNLANGFQALHSNTTGINNMGTGALALFANTTGIYNMANGSNAMFRNTTGKFNVAEGLNALYSNSTGSNNIAVGISAGGDLTTGGGNIDIGNRGLAAESSHIRIGTRGVQTNTFISGISGVAVAGGVGVLIDSNGHLGTVVSSARFKQEIQPMDKASEAIFSLKPVTFRYKHELDPAGIPQFGLVAEQVEKIDPDLVAHDDQGKVYTVRYEAVNAMLLNEFLKEHAKVETLENTVAELKGALKEQAAQIQKVSAKLAGQIPAEPMIADLH